MWSKNEVTTGQQNCDINTLYSGRGLLNINDTAIIGGKRQQVRRLSDSQRQVDFLMINATLLCDKRSAWIVVGEPDIYLSYDSIVLDKYWAKRKENAPKVDINISNYLSSHLQYEIDRMTQNMNKLSQAISVLDCLAEKAQQERLISLSLVSPVLAAEAAGFTPCYYLKAFGTTGLLSQCRSLNVTFTAHLNKCGHQPIYFNVSSNQSLTIGYDGKRLIDFKPEDCVHTNSRVNFGGIAYEFRDNNWVVIKPSKQVHSLHLNMVFDLEVDESEPYVTTSFQQSSEDAMSLLSELNGLLKGEGSASVSEFVDNTKRNVINALPKLTFFGALKSTLTILFSIAVVVGCFYLIYRLNCLSRFMALIRRRTSRSTVVSAPLLTPATEPTTTDYSHAMFNSQTGMVTFADGQTRPISRLYPEIQSDTPHLSPETKQVVLLNN